MNFCPTCGSGRVWHLKGTEVDTCHRGHHRPCAASECADDRERRTTATTTLPVTCYDVIERQLRSEAGPERLPGE